MSGILAAGDVFVDMLDDSGASTGLLYMADAKKFEINEPADVVKRISRGRDNYGQTAGSATLKKPATLSMEFDEIPTWALAILTLGKVSAFSQGSGSVSASAVTLKKGVWNRRPHMAWGDSGVTLTNSAADTTYVEGTDYKVDRRKGWIMPLTDNAATAGNKISYTYAAVSGEDIAGGAAPTKRGAIFLDGINLETQKGITVDIDEVQLTPTSPVDLASAEFVVAKVTGELRTLPGKTAPYVIRKFA